MQTVFVPDSPGIAAEVNSDMNKSLTIRIKQNNKHQSLFFLILFLAVLTRFLWVGNIPGNCAVNQDEAYAGYEAWSILHYGHDSWGYTMPVYLTTWGSGMSALQTYLMIPWVAVFGLTPFAIRLPQAIHGVLTIVAFYFLAKKIRGERFALTAMAFLTIVPWHIMISRWAYDCNFLPGFLVYSLLFLVMGTENRRYLLLSGLFFGLSLYTYAADWMVLPILVFGSILWLLYCRKIHFSRYLLLFFIILAVMALPLILFVAVNMGVTPEIRTPFLSIPKMPSFRNGDYSLSPKALMSHMYETIMILIHQEDSRHLNSIGEIGIYYKISIIPFIIGACGFIYELFGKKTEASKLEFLLFIQFCCGLILGASLDEPLIHRVNIIHVPIVYFTAYGIYIIIEHYGKAAKYAAVTAYGACLFVFTLYYTVDYDNSIAAINHDGLHDALVYADSVPPKEIFVLSDGGTGIKYIYCVFNEKIPTDEFIATFHSTEDQLWVGDFEFELTDYTDAPITPGCVYLCSNDDHEIVEYMQNLRMEMHYYNSVVLGIVPN